MSTFLPLPIPIFALLPPPLLVLALLLPLLHPPFFILVIIFSIYKPVFLYSFSSCNSPFYSFFSSFITLSSFLIISTTVHRVFLPFPLFYFLFFSSHFNLPLIFQSSLFVLNITTSTNTIYDLLCPRSLLFISFFSSVISPSLPLFVSVSSFRIPLYQHLYFFPSSSLPLASSYHRTFL